MTRAAFVSILSLSLISTCHGVADSAREGDALAPAWRIEARELHVPAAASTALRASIAATPQPDVPARARMVPGTEDEWRTLIDERNRARLVPLVDVGNEYGVTIRRDTIEGVPVHRVSPNVPSQVHGRHVFIYLHGGAYVFGGGDSSVVEAATIAARAGIETVSIDYRMPPDFPFPAAVEDVVRVYRSLLEQYSPGAIAIGGTSAGGGLALSAVHQFKALGLPVAGAIYAGTPWADLTATGDTLSTNEGIDRVLVSYHGPISAAARLYAGGHDMKNPLLSPVYGDFSGFPPTYLVTGTRDLLLSDTARVHRKLRASGIVADLNVYEGMSHAGYRVVPEAPESVQVYGELAAFLARHLR